MKSTVILLTGSLCLAAALPWQKHPDQWSGDDAQRIISNSPWAQPATAAFPDPRKNETPESVYSLPGAAQAGMAGSRGVSDGRWDGGIARNTGGGLLPTLPVTVRWDSALPVRQAMTKLKMPGTWEEPKSYIITVEGLIPAGHYSKAAQLETKSSSDETVTENSVNSEQVLEGLMANSKLYVRGRAAISCENAKIESRTGTVQLSFPRTVEIKRSDKEVAFSTRFGSFLVEKRFRLSDLTYNGRLEL